MARLIANSQNLFTICTNCKVRFNNIAQTPWCPTCMKEMDEWDDQKNPSKEEESTKEKNKIVSIKLTQSFEPERKQPDLNIDLKISKERSKEIESIISRTKKKESESEPNGQDKTGSDRMLTTENTTLKTSTDLEPLSILPEIVETPLEVSTENSFDLEKEVSRSMSSLNELGKELFSSMKGLRSNLPDEAVRLYDPDRVLAAVQCSNQIVSTMRAKLELMKFAKDMK